MTTHHEREDTSAPVPIIRLWSSLLVPLQGDLTDGQATVLCADVLRDIERRGCSALIVDASGLWLVDSHLCSVIADLARSASLMGARTILSGLQPEVALTLLAMDVTLEGIETVLDLEQALESIGIVAPDTRNPGGIIDEFLDADETFPDHQEEGSE
jgi:rsbT antagonist protein RsbS